MLTKDEALRPLAAARTNEVVIATMASVRVWGRLSATPLDIAWVDSAMGHAADFALGIAMACPGRRVICLNGDGSMLMSLGTLATIAQSGASNLSIVVMQNGRYEITGNQPVPGGMAVDYRMVARGCGFVEVYTCATAAEYADVVPKILGGMGPVLASLQVEPGTDGPMRRAPTEEISFLREPISESVRRMAAELARV